MKPTIFNLFKISTLIHFSVHKFNLVIWGNQTNFKLNSSPELFTKILTMKILCTLALVLSTSFGLMAQQSLELYNSTNCALEFQLYALDIGACGNLVYASTFINPGGSATVPAPAGQEWLYAEISSNPYCPGGVGIAVGTPIMCNSTCSWFVPSMATVTNSGCNGCLPNVTAVYSDCVGTNSGYIRVYDF